MRKISFAKQYPSKRITGITLVPWQIDMAQQLNADAHLDRQISLLQADYLSTPIPSASADAAYALESCCHSPGEDKGLLQSLGTDDEHAMTAILALAASSANPKRTRCHALQTEAVDILVLAARRGDKIDVDPEGNADTSLLVPRLRVEGLIPERNYTLRRATAGADGTRTRFTALGKGEVAGDEWQIEFPNDPQQWIEAGQAAPVVVKDACAAF